MSEAREIDYAEMINRLITDFRPVKRLWPIALRLTLWILLGAAIVGVGAAAGGAAADWSEFWQPARVLAIAPLLLATLATAYLALRSAIPDRAASVTELSALGVIIAGSLLGARFAPVAAESLPAVRGSGWTAIPVMVGMATGPGLALWWLVQRGFPVQTRTTAALTGVAGFGFSQVAGQVLAPRATPPAWQVIFAGILLIGLAVTLGAGGLGPARRWRKDLRSSAAESSGLKWLGLQSMVPIALAFSVAIAIFAPLTGRENSTPVPDFDLAIASYQRSLTGLRANVPSGSIDAVVTAYAEHGMPAYMWDFGPLGFHLVGGRFDRLADGTPVTYTWFHGGRGDVMCMFKRTEGFVPPAVAHDEKRHLLFYRYKGFSVCLINVGGYGSFISVIVAPIPLSEFIPLVLKAAF